jgi:hypothetical protein
MTTNYENDYTLQENDNIIELIPRIKLDIIKEIYESLGVNLGKSNNIIDYRNYYQSNPMMLGGGMMMDLGTTFSIGNGKRAEVIKALGFSDNPTEAECASKMKTIKVPSLSKGELKITVHHQLTDNVYNAFKIMKEGGFDAYMIAGYCFRQINNPNNKSPNRALSMHSFGCAIDINWDKNPFVSHGKPLSSGDTDKIIRTTNSIAVRAMAANGFGWGGRYGDYMHFSAANGG